mmetsp:Transcript_5374/g.12313  ORF Transcript_5374/g.12313 Transcript_5374/m.12313 type:complete len:238 (+) Transcript_5374:1885-2598(+)
MCASHVCHVCCTPSTQPLRTCMSSRSRRCVAAIAATALSALPRDEGWLAACIATKPLQDTPIRPTLPLHQGCSAHHATTSSASSTCLSVYSSSISPVLSPVPRTSTRTHATPWAASHGYVEASRSTVPSDVRYGFTSTTVGKLWPRANSSAPCRHGSQTREASFAPSETGMYTRGRRLTPNGCFCSSTTVGRSIAISSSAAGEAVTPPSSRCMSTNAPSFWSVSFSMRSLSLICFTL